MTRPLALALLLSFSLAACDKAPAPPAAPAAPEPPAAPAAPAAEAAPASVAPLAALTVTGVETGTAVGDDGRVVAAKDSFAPTDTIIAAISLQNAGDTPVGANVTARWTDPDGGVFNEESQKKDFSGAQAVNFRVAYPRGLRPGKYKVEALLDGQPAGSHEFSIR